MRYAVFSDTVNQVLNISSIGFSQDTKVTRFGPGVRQFYIVHYVISGKGYYNGNPVKSGQGFLIYPGQAEVYYPDEDDPWGFLWFISSDSNMKELFNNYNINSKTQIFEYNFISDIKLVANEVISKSNSILNSLYMAELFLHILNKHVENTHRVIKSNVDVYMDFALNYIEKNIHLPIRIKELTKLLGISQPYLYKIFKERCSVSPKQYIIDRKLSLSENLLKDTALSITQIAHSVGFDDVLMFSKFFSSHRQSSPQNYRCKMADKTKQCKI